MFENISKFFSFLPTKRIIITMNNIILIKKKELLREKRISFEKENLI